MEMIPPCMATSGSSGAHYMYNLGQAMTKNAHAVARASWLAAHGAHAAQDRERYVPVVICFLGTKLASSCQDFPEVHLVNAWRVSNTIGVGVFV